MTTCACGCGASGTGALSASSVPNRNVLVTAPDEELLTLDEAKLRAGLDWPAGDPRDAQMELFIKAARERVERDTGLAFLTQTRDVYLSHLVHPIDFPAPALPLQAIADVAALDSASLRHTLPASAWTVTTSGRLRVDPAAWPPTLDTLYPYVVRIVVGWASVGEVPPLLQWAVGLLTAHYATVARDAVVVGTITATVPFGYEDAIADYRRVAV